MHVFVKALAVQTLEGGVGIVVNDKLIADTTKINNLIISPDDVEEIRINGYPLVFIKYVRAKTGKFDKNENWYWDLEKPFTDENKRLVIKYNKSNFTRKELLDIIAEYEFDGGKIPNPIGLLNRLFDELKYPIQGKNE